MRTALPAWLQDHLTDEALFVEAYDQATPRRRAWMKTCISRLHAWCGEELSTAGDRRTKWKQGFSSREFVRPLDWALVLLGPAEASPVRVLAAGLPALFAGVADVSVVRVGEQGLPWAPDLLAALELAGLETVACLEAEKLGQLIEESSGHGAVVSLGPAAPKGLVAHGFWSPRRPTSVGVWFDSNEIPPDLERLAWAHPDIPIEVWSTTGTPKLPRGLKARTGDFKEFLGAGHFAAVAPQRLANTAQEHFPLVLGPGSEGCWLWPGLDMGFFQYRSVFWTTNE